VRFGDVPISEVGEVSLLGQAGNEDDIDRAIAQNVVSGLKPIGGRGVMDGRTAHSCRSVDATGGRPLSRLGALSDLEVAGDRLTAVTSAQSGWLRESASETLY